MRLLKLSLILLVVIIAACSDDSTGPTPPVTDENDEYTVYSALIDSMFIFEATKLIVISDSTEPYDLSSDASQNFIKTSLKVSDTLLNAYNSRNDVPSVLRRAFTISTDYVLLGVAEHQDILSTGGWEEFYRQYPASQGYLTLSRVGFSEDGNTALVYASNTPAFLAGMGVCALLEKQGGEWKVTATVIVWVS